MRSGTFYPQVFKKSKYTQRQRIIRLFLLAGILLFLMPAASMASPTYVNGTPQSITVCSNGNVDISALLTVSDAPGVTETWTIFGTPGSGTLVGFTPGPVSAMVGAGGTATPAGLLYVPGTGAISDAFSIQVSDGTNTSVMVFQVTINSAPSVVLGANPSVCSGDTVAHISFTGMTNAGPDTTIFGYTGAAQTWIVPNGVSNIAFNVTGASGGNDSYNAIPVPGKGGRVQGTLAVTAGSTLNLYIGGVGGNGTTTGGVGGFNGGGNSNYDSHYGTGGAGGGASDIRVGGTALANRVVVAGGGGGSAWDSIARSGGGGGGLTGGISDNNYGGFHASGGSQIAGGAPATYAGWIPASAGTLAVGGAGSIQGISAGGGGGYYGGGGGLWTGGGGGSSYTDVTTVSGVTHTQGYNTGNGAITLAYVIAATYTITWNSDAIDSGFVNVTNAALPMSTPFAVSVPSTVSPGTYTGTITISNNSCSSEAYSFSVTVKPTPTVILPADQSLCAGSMTTDVNFSSSYNWTNNNTSIGLAASGSGHIASFTVTNTTTVPSTATITITPSLNGCVGTPASFHITANPIPSLSSTLTPPAICDSNLFSYIPTSPVFGTVFTWSRAAVAGISNPSDSGSNNPNEYLVNTDTIPVVVTYVDTLTANGCVNTQNVNVTVNPKPILTSTLTPAAVCDSTLFSYMPASAVPGTIFTWSRAAVPGISNPSDTGSNNPNEYLVNTTDTPIAVTYVYTLSINGCSYVQNVMVTVNPMPVLTSTLTPAAICDSSLFSYIPASNISEAVISWNRAAIDGISNAAASGTGSINEYLVDTTANPIIVTYTDTIRANGCYSTQNVAVVVNPKPVLSSVLSAPAICTNTLFSYVPASATGGTVFHWERDTVSGIANPPLTGGGGVSELLINTTPDPITVTYTYTLLANGCSNVQTVSVVVNPQPKLNSVTTAAICDSAIFNYTPLSLTAGTTFNWGRPYVSGIANIAASGTGDPNESLVNTTYINVDAAYVYTLTANGCSNTQSVTVTVHPTPLLSSSLSAIVCSGVPVNYTPIGYTSSSTFTWTQDSVTGITPATATGSGAIIEALVNNTSSLIAVPFTFVITAYGCSHTESITVSVNPAPAVPSITTMSPSSVCNNTMYQNFGTNIAAPAGVTYRWSATNASIWAVGANGQYCIVSFDNPGEAVVTLSTNAMTTSCLSNSSYTVNVGTTVADMPEVVYFEGQLVCKQTNVDSYQWGFDNTYTLDSTIIPGETNQNYSVGSFPDISDRYYWVMTTHNGCLQKAYYNPPANGVSNVNAEVSGIKVYPNPASNFINVDITAPAGGSIEITVSNMLGQKLNTVSATGNKANINVASLPAGCYLIDCLRDGVKIASSKFIKN